MIAVDPEAMKSASGTEYVLRRGGCRWGSSADRPVALLDAFLVHRSRTLEKEDGKPPNDVRMLQLNPSARRPYSRRTIRSSSLLNDQC
jgi:hypothetical protein